MFDCIVVGGGLIGMLTARELQQSGVKNVLLLEKGALGGESTWAGGGILSPLYPWRYPDAVSVLAQYGQQHYAQIAQQLLDESGVDPEYTRSGMLVLDQDERDVACNWAAQWQLQTDVLENRSLHAREPALAETFNSALWMPDIAQMRNPRLIKSLRGSLQQRHIEFREGEAVTQLDIAGGRIQGVTTSVAHYKSDKVVIAGGAWSPKLPGKSGKRTPAIEPVKGQMILFKGAPGLLKTIVLYQGRYLIPRRDGRILAGSTLEHTGFDKRITDAARQDLYTAATAIMPQLTTLEIEHHWAGLRPGSPQGVPYICAHPDIIGLYINSGHFRNGVILGAASARLMVDLVTGLKPTIDPSFYDFGAEH